MFLGVVAFPQLMNLAKTIATNNFILCRLEQTYIVGAVTLFLITRPNQGSTV